MFLKLQAINLFLSLNQDNCLVVNPA